MFWLPLFPPPPELEPVDAGGGGGVKLGVNAGSVRDVKVDSMRGYLALHELGC